MVFGRCGNCGAVVVTRHSGPGPLYKNLIALKNRCHIAIIDYVADQNIDDHIIRLRELVFELERANCTPNGELVQQLEQSAKNPSAHLGARENA